MTIVDKILKAVLDHWTLLANIVWVALVVESLAIIMRDTATSTYFLMPYATIIITISSVTSIKEGLVRIADFLVECYFKKKGDRKN